MLNSLFQNLSTISDAPQPPIYGAANEDVMMSPKIFHFARKQLRYKPSVDLFASAAHHQLPRYYSATPDPASIGQDAFQHPWHAESRPYANPPWSLIPRVLHKIRTDRVQCMLVVPDWPDVQWYPLYRRLLLRYIVIKEPLYLDNFGILRRKPPWHTWIGIVDGNRAPLLSDVSQPQPEVSF